jgi:hypothetical protein
MHQSPASAGASQRSPSLDRYIEESGYLDILATQLKHGQNPAVRMPAGIRSHHAGWSPIALLIGTLLLPGCTAPRGGTVAPRPFSFATDTMTFTNELTWVYGYDHEGQWRGTRREPEPTYSLRCFAVTRSTLQFYLNARFAPEEPQATEATYRFLVRRVVRSDTCRARPDSDRLVIPGYPDLRSFSAEWTRLLQEECGSAWGSYFQRGNWRMIFPFSRRGQASTASHLVDSLTRSQPAIVHLVCFPDLTLNHAMLVFGFRENPEEILFETYDPNHPERSTVLTFDRDRRTFQLPATDYFPGGDVNAYQIYCGPFL